MPRSLSAKLSSRYENTRTWNLALKEHEAVLRALEARDPLAAQAAILTHLKASEDRWIAGLYAAGELVGGLFYHNYPGGTGLMSGAVFGKIAGASAAAAARQATAAAAS